jgi:hypothetical protein
MKWVITLLCVTGCGSQKLKLEPVKVEPIHMTIDVNLHDGKPPPER